ncbi:unnamed protein product [Caenorhabditis angaria]|uniref:Peptidase M12B domain-containing protein n=1 Tax=Caenorhabditis angaria TaxID=860376 RepID=A0A9P1N8B2_9PELO|nr:unnamed protein product [Caenorhabditis angaria]
MKILVLLIFLEIFDASDSPIRFVKKRIEGGLKFSRTLLYTNKSIEGIQPTFNSQKMQEMSLELLMVADFSTYLAFLEMSNGDVGSAQHYLNNYLNALFEQAKIVYDGIKFGNDTMKLKLAGRFIALREEDCPLWLTWEEVELEKIQKIENIFNETNVEEDFNNNNSTDFDFDIESNMTSVSSSKVSKENIQETTRLRHYVETNFDELQEQNNTEMSLRIDAKLAVDKFMVWIKEHQKLLPHHEHAVLITKFDLISVNGDSSTQGMAYVGNVCQIGKSSSVVEDIGGSLTALIAAHEIGHSLGAAHDGSFEAPQCDSNDNYLLAALISGSSDRLSFLNSRKMSNCSIDAILENLKDPDASCIRKWKSISKTSNTTSGFDRKPGEIINVYQQCQIAFGPNFGNCLNNGYYYGKSICERIWCGERKIDSNGQCQTLNYFPAFDGTECGYNMWCIAGECVNNPKKWMDCKDLNAKTCSKYSPSKLKHFCKSKDFRDTCCQTCAKKGNKKSS